MATSKKAVAKYKRKTYDTIQILAPKGERDEIKAHAGEVGESLNKFILRAIRETIERDKLDKVLDKMADKTESNRKD